MIISTNLGMLLKAETLYLKLQKKYNTTVSLIKSLNSQEYADIIRVGERLLVLMEKNSDNKNTFSINVSKVKIH